MLLRLLFGCLFLTVMSRYGDAYKSNANYLEAILLTLERIEIGIHKIALHSGCVGSSHTEKSAHGSIHERSRNDDDEVHPRGFTPHAQSLNMITVRRALSRSDEDDEYQLPLRKPKRSRSSNRNQNMNSNSNINTNTNVNTNRAKILDISDEITPA